LFAHVTVKVAMLRSRKHATEKFFPSRPSDERATELNIRLRLQGESRGLPSSLVTDSLLIIEVELFQLENEDMRAMFRELGDLEISQEIEETCFDRLTEFKGKSFVIEQAETGSIVLAGLAVGAAYWIIHILLEKHLRTLGRNRICTRV